MDKAFGRADSPGGSGRRDAKRADAGCSQQYPWVATILPLTKQQCQHGGDVAWI